MLEQLTILAPGLLGGSVARAARARGLARRIVIWARRPETRLQLHSQAWCDEVADTPEAAVRNASLVILAPPVDKIILLAKEIAPHLQTGAIVTDVGSVKGEISRLGHSALLKGTHFVGSHPMAGSDKTGWENSSVELFEKRVCFVTPLPESDSPAVDTVVRFWNDIGMEVVTIDPDSHDELVAHISHLPQVIASTLCSYLATKDLRWRNFSGGGLRDTTRIAGGDPTMWKAILEQNRDEILRSLREYQDELQAFTAALANKDYIDLAARLERARAYRRDFRI